MNGQPENVLTFGKIKISKQMLDKMPEEERYFFLQIMTFFQEVNILNKLAVSSFEVDGNDIARKAQNCQSVFIVLILAGKLFEGWKVIRKDWVGTKVSQKWWHELNDLSKNSYEFLKQYFGRKDNCIKNIRNSFAFHYETEKIKEFYAKLPDDNEFELYVSDNAVNCFSTTYLLALQKIANDIHHDEAVALDTMLREVFNVTAKFRDFIGGCLFLLITKHFGKHENVEVEIDSELQHLKIPFFVLPPKEL